MEIGSVYNYWTVVGNPTKAFKPNGEPYWKIPCQCVCGKLKEVNKFSLTSGRSLSCSCETKGKHRESGSRLYHCWENMKQRARLRTLKGYPCSVCEDWQTYEGFKSWALLNGYKDKLELLRGTPDSPDVGDYTPENARWGTHRENYLDYTVAKEKRETLHMNVLS